MLTEWIAFVFCAEELVSSFEMHAVMVLVSCPANNESVCCMFF